MVENLRDVADEALVAAYCADPAGERGRAALTELVARWSDRVHLWTRRFVRDRDAALDVTQDCFVRAIEALPRYQARGRFGAWLFTIVHNRCRSMGRPRSWRHDPEIDADALASDDAGPEEVVGSAESLRAILASMDAVLDSRERAALWMRAEGGMSVDEITTALRVTEASGARGLLQTARRKLRAELARRAGSPQEHP